MRHIFSGYIRKASDREKMIANLEKNFIGNWPEEMQRCMSGLSENSMKAMIEVLVNYRIGPGVEQPIYCLYGAGRQIAVNAHRSGDTTRMQRFISSKAIIILFMPISSRMHMPA